jgi:hypothetical protein
MMNSETGPGNSEFGSDGGKSPAHSFYREESPESRMVRESHDVVPGAEAIPEADRRRDKEEASPVSRFSKRWLLGRQLTNLDEWPRPVSREGDGDDKSPLGRLNWSIEWHTLAHRQATRWYTGLKAIQISAAAAIPVVTAVGGNSLMTKGWIAGLGALVVVLEGVQQLKKYASHALLWGQGKEALKQEYYLYKEQVGVYSGEDRDKVLARRIEQIIGAEVGQWAGSLHDGEEARPGASKRANQPDQGADQGG